jgi:hypothetical protein
VERTEHWMTARLPAEHQPGAHMAADRFS